MKFSRPPWFFPPKHQPVMREPSLSTQLAEVMLKGKRVLFLDDDHYLQQLVNAVSKKYDLQLVSARTSGDARMLIERTEPFDAAILDVNVANGDGINLYQWIKDNYPKMAVVFLTGYNSEIVAEKIHAIGSAPIYSKPSFSQTKFIGELFEQLGARRKIASPA